MYPLLHRDGNLQRTLQSCAPLQTHRLTLDKLQRSYRRTKSSARRCLTSVSSEGVCRRFLLRASKAFAAGALSLLATGILYGSSGSTFDRDPLLDPAVPVLDLARILPDVQERELASELRDLEERTGWRLRLLTRNGPQQGPSGEEVKRAWGYNRRTAVVICDPTSPNILQFQAGQEVVELLRRGFFIELQSRFGNIFFVRDEGEAAAVLGTLKALGDCLERGGCFVVPGLPKDQYQLTLITSLIGGCVFGYSTTLEPGGFVSRRLIWPLLFSPLWGTLFLSFGIGPIVTRTEDKLPLLQNFAAFLAAAAFFRLSPLFKPGAQDFDLISKEGRKKQDAEDNDDTSSN